MRASEVKSRLERDLNALHNSVVAMEAERIKLALPALTGDAEAMLRVVELRTEIDSGREGLRDLEQALSDIGPAVSVEKATDRLRQRKALREVYHGICDEVMDTMGAIDAAVLGLGKALGAAIEPVERARQIAVELALPLTGGDVGHLAMQRMIIAQNIGIRSVRELVETALEDVQVLLRDTAPFPHRPDMRLTDQMRRSLDAIDLRVGEALRDDERIAVQAGVVLEPEAA